MLLEIHQIKRFLAKQYNLPLENADSAALCRVVGKVPDCEHMIPLGVTEVLCRVVVKDDRILIDPP
jgi:hypothetical protein